MVGQPLLSPPILRSNVYPSSVALLFFPSQWPGQRDVVYMIHSSRCRKRQETMCSAEEDMELGGGSVLAIDVPVSYERAAYHKRSVTIWKSSLSMSSPHTPTRVRHLVCTSSASAELVVQALWAMCFCRQEWWKGFWGTIVLCMYR